VYASRTPEDIILKTELDALSVVHRNFKVRAQEPRGRSHQLTPRAT
jgi:hypothetical protein